MWNPFLTAEERASIRRGRELMRQSNPATYWFGQSVIVICAVSCLVSWVFLLVLGAYVNALALVLFWAGVYIVANQEGDVMPVSLVHLREEMLPGLLYSFRATKEIYATNLLNRQYAEVFAAAMPAVSLPAAVAMGAAAAVINNPVVTRRFWGSSE